MNYQDFYKKEQTLSGGKGDDLSSRLNVLLIVN